MLAVIDRTSSAFSLTTNHEPIQASLIWTSKYRKNYIEGQEGAAALLYGPVFACLHMKNQLNTIQCVFGVNMVKLK